MSAANLFVRSSAAMLIADRAALAGDGRLLVVKRKITSRADFRFAFTIAGPGSNAHDDLRSAWLEDQVSEDAALANAPTLLADLQGSLAGADWQYDPDRVYGDRLAMVIAMWSSARNRAEGYVMASAPGIFPSHVPIGRPHSASQYMSPTIDAAGIDPRAHPDDFARSLLERQRLSTKDYGWPVVGGGGDVAIVAESGVTVRHIGTWPDRIGELLDPSPSMIFPR